MMKTLLVIGVVGVTVLSGTALSRRQAARYCGASQTQRTGRRIEKGRLGFVKAAARSARPRSTGIADDRTASRTGGLLRGVRAKVRVTRLQMPPTEKILSTRL